MWMLSLDTLILPFWIQKKLYNGKISNNGKGFIEEEIDNIFSKNKISNLNIKEALKIIHNPSVEDDILKIKNFEHPAQKRLIIEELVTNLIGVKISTDKIDKMIAPEIDSSSET